MFLYNGGGSDLLSMSALFRGRRVRPWQAQPSRAVPLAQNMVVGSLDCDLLEDIIGIESAVSN